MKTYMPNDYVTRKDLEEVVGAIVGEASREIVATIAEVMEQRFDETGKRFDRLETRIDGLEMRMSRIETRMDSVEMRFDRVENKLDQTINRTDTHSELLHYNLKIGRLKQKPA